MNAAGPIAVVDCQQQLNGARFFLGMPLISAPSCQTVSEIGVTVASSNTAIAVISCHQPASAARDHTDLCCCRAVAAADSRGQTVLTIFDRMFTPVLIRQSDTGALFGAARVKNRMEHGASRKPSAIRRLHDATLAKLLVSVAINRQLSTVVVCLHHQSHCANMSQFCTSH